MKKKNAAPKKSRRATSGPKAPARKKSGSKTARPSLKKKAPEGDRELVINSRRVKISERGGQVSMTIDGIPVGMMFKSPHGTYNTHLFPSHTYDTPEEMAKMLVETEGRLWLLKKSDHSGGMGGMPMSGGTGSNT